MVKNRFLIHRSGCAVCGKPLIYHTVFRKAQCYCCEKEKETDVICEDGHFVCDECHRIDANDLIFKESLAFRGTDPLYFVNKIMENDLINIQIDNKIPLEYLNPVRDLAQPVAGPTDQNLLPMIKKSLQHLFQGHDTWHNPLIQNIHIQLNTRFQVGVAKQRLHK